LITLTLIKQFLFKYKTIILFVVGFLIGLILNFNNSKPIIKKTTKIEYIVKNNIDTILSNPKVEYKYKDKIVVIKNTDTIIKNFKPKDYEWVYNKTDTTKNKKTIINIKANGWGNLTKLDYIINTKDTTKIITNTIEKTIIKTPNTLYLSCGYNSNNNPNIGIDWTIKNKFIMGGIVQYDNKINEPVFGVKIGVKL
jgi:cellobiose-specific phosphotransferase system component IIB